MIRRAGAELVLIALAFSPGLRQRRGWSRWSGEKRRPSGWRKGDERAGCYGTYAERKTGRGFRNTQDQRRRQEDEP